MATTSPTMNEAMSMAVPSFRAKFKFRLIGLTKSTSKKKSSCGLSNDDHVEEDNLPSLVARSIFYMKPSSVRSVDNRGFVTLTNWESTTTFEHTNKKMRGIVRCRKRKGESQGMISRKKIEKMSIEARRLKLRLSPESKRKHDVFWSQMDTDDGNSSSEDNVPHSENEERDLSISEE